MHVLLFLSFALLSLRFVHAALNEIICHDDVVAWAKPLTELAFSDVDAETRLDLTQHLTDEGHSPQLIRLFETPQPLEHPMNAAECLDAVNLIPNAPHLDTHNPGDPARLALLYTASQRQNVLRYRLDAGFVAGNCAVQISRRPSSNPYTDGLRHADASAMALVVYPHAREKARAIIQQCLSGAGGQRRYRFGHVGTKSTLNGLDFYYVISVTVWSAEQVRDASEHYYNQAGEIQMTTYQMHQGWLNENVFPFVDAFD